MLWQLRATPFKLLKNKNNRQIKRRQDDHTGETKSDSQDYIFSDINNFLEMCLTEIRSCKKASGVNSDNKEMQLKDMSRWRNLMKTWIPVEMTINTTKIRFLQEI